MSFSECEIKSIEIASEKFLNVRRPPVEIRSELDFKIQILGQSVQIFEVRPHYKDPSLTVEMPIAKATFVKKSNRWKIYWMRGNLKWYLYLPKPETPKIDGFFETVIEDVHGCFFG